MAYLTTGAGAFVPTVSHLIQASEPVYVQSVFRAFDDVSSSSISIGTRDSPGAAFSPTHVTRLSGEHSASINPSTFEMAEGLIRMRSGAQPMTATPQGQFAHETPAMDGDKPYAPTNQDGRHAVAPGDYPTVSTSSEENAGRNSDVFSVADNSDTITDPDVDQAERNPSGPPQRNMRFSAEMFRERTPELDISLDILQRQPDGLHSQASVHAAQVDGVSEASAAEAQPPQSRPYDPSAPIALLNGHQCGCRAVPQVFLTILDKGKVSDGETIAKLYGACRYDLCSLHLDAYARFLTRVIETSSAALARASSKPRETTERAQPIYQVDAIVQTGAGTKWTAVRRRKRATSIPGIDEIELELPCKKRCLAVDESHRPVSQSLDAQRPLQHMYGPQQSLPDSQTPPPPPPSPPQPEFRDDYRPPLDVAHNEEIRRRVLAELAQNFTDKKEDDWSRGETTNRYIHSILSKCQHPNTDIRKGPVDCGFLSGKDAAVVLEKGTERLPIFTAGQQQFKWTGNQRPIAQLFQRMEDLSRRVSVQIPSRNFDLPSYETKSLTEIRDRFLQGQVSQDPWNILDLRSPLPPSILPSFLTGENCQLLPRIRDSLLEGQCAERIKASREEWNEWTELLEWVLMSEGGHNTAPHMDSHGWSTWITIQEGNFGFGWLSRPTDKEQDDWISDPLDYTGGNWRYVILKPGQTVFFPSGTVHFVFRLHAQQTLALGGHLLQWTALERWVQVILYQLKNPNITNEDLGTAPLKYIRSARNLVKNRIQNYRVTPMGGMATVTRFMALATEVERWYSKKKKKRSR